MARYRKVDPRIWNDAKFRALNDQGKLSFFFLLTHPHMTAIGAMRASLPGLASEIGWSEKAFREAFGEASTKGMAMHDESASLIWLPHFLRYNPPESPNVVKAWSSALDLLPECALLNRVIAGAVAFAQGLNKGFAEALPEVFAKAMPYQEQEQEQESISNEIDSAAAKSPRFHAQKWLESKGVPKQVAADWIKLRKAKRLESTLTAFEGVEAEAQKAGFPLATVIACCAKNSWGSFKASWDHGLGGEGGVRAGHWFMSAPGIEEKARALGMMQTKDEIFPNFKARVYAAAGVTEAMVRAAKIDAGERV